MNTVLCYGQVRQWTPDPLESVICLLNDRVAALTALNDDIGAAEPFTSWKSEAADKAAETHRGITNRMEDIVASVAATRRIVVDIADRIRQLQWKVEAAEDTARQLGCRIDDSGEPVPLDTCGPLEFLFFVRYVRVRALVRDVMETADEIDSDFSFVLNKVITGDVRVSDKANSLTDASLAGNVRGSVRHARLLDEFHVTVDDRPLGPLGGLLNRFAPTDEGKGFNRGETDLLIGLGLGGMFDFKDLSSQAIVEAAERFPGESLVNDKGDAFRHAYWNALLAQRFGDEFATQYGTAHEQNDGDPVAHAMDLHNNEAGRDIGLNTDVTDPEKLGDLVYQEVVQGGATVYINELGELVPTNDTSTPPTSPHVEKPESVQPDWYGLDLLRNPRGF